jgi:hypothetical protein
MAIAIDVFATIGEVDGVVFAGSGTLMVPQSARAISGTNASKTNTTSQLHALCDNDKRRATARCIGKR